MIRKFLAPVSLAVVLMVVHAGASVVTNLPGGTVFAMPGVDYYGPGPQTFGSGSFVITWSSTNAYNGAGGATFGNTGLYGSYLFGSNGQWTGALGPMAGLNDSTDYSGVTESMTFAFSQPVAAVGGFLNYVPGSSNPTTIAVWDSGGNLIESYNLTFTTNGANDTGAFYGFRESSAIISSFTLIDNWVGITDFTVTTVPEPSSLLLIGSGLVGVIGYGRRGLGR